MTSPAFLTAEWRSLLLYNVVVDPAWLQPLVPTGTELDLWHGTAFISLVGFRFLHTRLKGWRIPFHQHFDEVNLRFYVRRKVGNEWRRGVVFIKEVVPLPAVSFVARWVYHENYVTRPMRHTIESASQPGRVEYAWRDRGQWLQLSAEVNGPVTDFAPGTDADFILEHYWGYTRQRNGATCEYAVEHPRWRIWANATGRFTGDAAEFYGHDFATALQQPPHSVIVAEGSSVVVRQGTRLPPAPEAKRPPAFS